MGLPISRRNFLFAGASFATYALAQDPQTPTFSSDVNVVNVLATVHDKSGKIIRTLTKDDFAMEDDSKPQVIKYFAQQSDLPLTLGLLIDTSGSVRNVLDQERSASLRFLEQVMRPDKDRAFVIHFDSQVELLQDLTSSRRDLEKSLDDLEVSRPNLNRRGQGGGGSQGGSNYPDDRDRNNGGGGRGFGGGTKLQDAVFLSADEVLKKQQGRKAVIVLSDGADRGSSTTLTGAIESAQRADTVVYAIHFAGESGNSQRPGGGFPGGGRRGGIGIGFPGGGGMGYPGGGGGGRRGGGGQRPMDQVDGKKILERLARETGGGYFEVTGKKTFSDIFSSIEEELRSQYSLGFTPDKDRPGYHDLKVTVKDKGLIAQARSGYYQR